MSVLSPILHVLSLSLEKYLVRSTYHEASHYALFSGTQLPRPRSAQIPSSVPYSRKPLAYIPSLSLAKFHTHIKPQAEL